MTDRQFTVFYDGPEYKAEGELCDGLLFLHCTVRIHSKTVLKQIKLNLELIKSEVRKLGYSLPIFSYTQNGKWVRLIGGEYHNTFEHEGETYEVYKWE